MTCINNEIIQKYIDGEATPKEIVRIEKHIIKCEKCALKVVNLRDMANKIKTAINLLAEDTIVIPSIAIPPALNKKRSFTTRRIIYTIAAACILLFIVVISQKKEPENQPVTTIEPGFALDIDANRPVSQQSLVITIIDSEGNVSEYFN